MSSLNEKAEPTVNVLTITRPSPIRQFSNTNGSLSPIEDVDSTHSLTPTHTQEKSNSLDQETSAFSPFYNPNPTRQSLEAQKTESKQNINVISSPYDTDVEAGLVPERTNASSGQVRLCQTKTDRSVWPGQREMKLKKKAMRQARGKHMLCGCMAGMDKKKALWIKVLIAFVVVGAAIGVGVGISRAVGGGVWKNKNTSNAPIQGSTAN